MNGVDKVSFTIRRPTPVSRASSSGVESDGNFKVPSLPRHLKENGSNPGSPLGRSTTSSPAPPPRHDESDSSDAEDGEKDELVTGFDRFGVQRLHKEKRSNNTGPLVIPALKNRDWREVARKRKTVGQYVPSSAKAQTGADGSVGGLGTRDTINSGPLLSGLQVKKEVKHEEGVKQEDTEVDVDVHMGKVEEDEDEEKRALRAILEGANGAPHDGPIVDVIPTPASEADAFHQDVGELPESATLSDYDRVPVSQFGAALLRGMGWKEGTAATRQPGKGLVEPYLPQARPTFLGLGAKPQEVLDDGSKKKGKNKRPEKYVPLVKLEREDRSKSSSGVRDRSRSPGRPHNGSSAVSSRSSMSKSRERRRDYDDTKRDRSERDRDGDRDYRRSDYDRDRSYREERQDRRRDDSRNSHRRRD